MKYIFQLLILTFCPLIFSGFAAFACPDDEACDTAKHQHKDHSECKDHHEAGHKDDHKDEHHKKHKHKKKREHKEVGPEVLSKSGVKFSGLWIRKPSEKAKNTAGYLKIENTSDKDVKIKEIIASDAASGQEISDRIEIHGYKNDDEIKKMYKLESITIPAKSTIKFKPGSFHIMIMGLKKHFEKDSDIKLTVKLIDSITEASIEDVKLSFKVR